MSSIWLPNTGSQIWTTSKNFNLTKKPFGASGIENQNTTHHTSNTIFHCYNFLSTKAPIFLCRCAALVQRMKNWPRALMTGQYESGILYGVRKKEFFEVLNTTVWSKNNVINLFYTRARRLCQMCRFAPAKRTSRIGFQTRPIAISSDPACTQVHGYGREMEFERTLAHHGLVDQTVCHPAIKSRAENFPWAKKKAILVVDGTIYIRL